MPLAEPSSPGKPSTPEEPQLEPAPKLDHVSGANVIQLPSDESSILIVDGEHPYESGQFLTAAPEPGTPEGFLLKVVSSTDSGGNTEVQTEPGSLYEAVPNGEIDADLADLGAARPDNPAARQLSGAALGQSAISAASAEPESSAKIPFKKLITCKGSAKMTLTGSLSTSLKPHINIKWHKHFGIPFGVDRARATLDASVQAYAQGSVSGKDGCALKPITLFDPKWTVYVPVGEIPVPVTIEVPIVLRAEAEVSGSVVVSANAGAQGSFGVAYENNGVDAIHNFSTAAELQHAAKAKATLEATVGPNVSIVAGYKIPFLGKLDADLGVDVASGPRLVYDTTLTPPGSLCVPLALTESLELDLPDVAFKQGPATLFNKNIRCVQWGGGGGAETEEDENGEVSDGAGGEEVEGGAELSEKEIEEQTERILKEVEEQEAEGEVEWGEIDAEHTESFGSCISYAYSGEPGESCGWEGTYTFKAKFADWICAGGQWDLCFGEEEFEYTFFPNGAIGYRISYERGLAFACDGGGLNGEISKMSASGIVPTTPPEGEPFSRAQYVIIVHFGHYAVDALLTKDVPIKRTFLECGAEEFRENVVPLPQLPPFPLPEECVAAAKCLSGKMNLPGQFWGSEFRDFPFTGPTEASWEFKRT